MNSRSPAPEILEIQFSLCYLNWASFSDLQFHWCHPVDHLHDGDASLGCTFCAGDGIWVGNTDTGLWSTTLESDGPPVWVWVNLCLSSYQYRRKPPQPLAHSWWCSGPARSLAALLQRKMQNCWCVVERPFLYQLDTGWQFPYTYGIDSETRSFFIDTVEALDSVGMRVILWTLSLGLLLTLRAALIGNFFIFIHIKLKRQ